jgi:hypothetical protein
MTPVPYAVWRAGLDKWEEGANCTKRNWKKWWDGTGCRFCSFCFHYDGGFECEKDACPLHVKGFKGCAFEFEDAYIAEFNNNFPAFHLAAVALRDRIAALPHEEA